MFVSRNLITSKLKPEQGFTLIELMITIAIMAIIMGVAVPAYTKFITRTEVKNSNIDFQADLKFASDQARASGECVALAVRKINGRRSAKWSTGYNIWADVNCNKKINDEDTVLRYRDSLPATVKVQDFDTSITVKKFLFVRDGSVKGLVSMRATVCPENNIDTIKGRAIAILPSGMVTLVDRQLDC